MLDFGCHCKVTLARDEQCWCRSFRFAFGRFVSVTKVAGFTWLLCPLVAMLKQVAFNIVCETDLSLVS